MDNILIILLLTFFINGCSKFNENSTLKTSKKVIEALRQNDEEAIEQLIAHGYKSEELRDRHIKEALVICSLYRENLSKAIIFEDTLTNGAIFIEYTIPFVDKKDIKKADIRLLFANYIGANIVNDISSNNFGNYDYIDNVQSMEDNEPRDTLIPIDIELLIKSQRVGQP